MFSEVEGQVQPIFMPSIPKLFPQITVILLTIALSNHAPDVLICLPDRTLRSEPF